MITAMPRIAIAVHDFAAAVHTFREVFGLPVADFSDRTVPDLGAHVGMCQPEGGSNIELMAPANPELPLSQALQKFLDRRGDGFYAMMLEAPDPDAEAVVLAERDLAVMPLMRGAGGRDIHPRSNHGVLIRVYPDNSVRKLDGLAHLDPAISGVMRAVVATADAAKAADTFGRGFGLEVGPASVDEDRGVLRVICTPPKGGVVELVSPVDVGRPFARAIANTLEERGEGLYGLVLHATDGPAALDRLRERGLALGGPDGNEADVFGARIIIE